MSWHEFFVCVFKFRILCLGELFKWGKASWALKVVRKCSRIISLNIHIHLMSSTWNSNLNLMVSLSYFILISNWPPNNSIQILWCIRWSAGFNYKHIVNVYMYQKTKKKLTTTIRIYFGLIQIENHTHHRHAFP